MTETFEQVLAGGHPNSLGRTIEVVEIVLARPERIEELFNCYHCLDEVVRLRVSNAMKRIEAADHAMLLPYIDRFLTEVGPLDQPSAQWTLAQLFERFELDMTSEQRQAALEIMKRNLTTHNDWIVLNTTIQTLGGWAKEEKSLAEWLKPHLRRLASDDRKSVAKRAAKALNALEANAARR